MPFITKGTEDIFDDLVADFGIINRIKVTLSRGQFASAKGTA